VLPPGHREVAFDDLVFATPSGRIELESAEAEQRWGVDPVADHREPREHAQPGPFPLWLLTPNTKNRIHSQFGNLASIRRVSGELTVAVHPGDAAERGITEGDRVRVHNERGELTLPARLDPSLRRGCVCVHNGIWITEGGTVNFCSLGRETDMGHGAAFHDNAVQLEKVR
jgi:anaerobic selenocysteine-containing dehydrogenase